MAAPADTPSLKSLWVRVAIVSDTHGFLDPRVLAVAAGCDLAIHGGDIGSDCVLAALAAALAQGERGEPGRERVLAVRGNNDLPESWPDSERATLAALPETIAVDLPGGPLIVIHGHRTPARDRHARLRRRFPQARALVYGHSHRLALDCEAQPWVMNPGAAGRTRTYGGPSCLVLDARPGAWRIETHRFEPLSGPFQRPRKDPEESMQAIDTKTLKSL